MSPFMTGFATEIAKTAGPREFFARFHKSKDLRRAVLRAAVLGAGSGAVTGALSRPDEGESRTGRALRHGAVGAVGGAISGAAFPAWFSHHQRLADDEQVGGHPITRAVSAIGLGTLGSLGYKAYKTLS